MTIIDTLADSHYGDRVKMAFAFAELLNEEAKALEADGVNMIQFDEPAFNVFMDEVPDWGIKALERARRADLRHRRAHLLRLRHQGQHRLEADAGQRVAAVREIFPAIAKSPIQQVAIECRNSKVPLDLLRCSRQDRAGRRDRRRQRHGGDRGGRRQGDRRRLEIRAEEQHHRHHQLRHGADAPRYRGSQTDGARAARTGEAELVSRVIEASRSRLEEKVDAFVLEARKDDRMTLSSAAHSDAAPADIPRRARAASRRRQQHGISIAPAPR
jgi:hypothetical protein